MVRYLLPIPRQAELNEESEVRTERVWLQHSKGVREKGKEDRKFSSTCGLEAHDLLLSRQAHYHCPKGEAASGR